MKIKFLSLAILLALVFGIFAGCADTNNDAASGTTAKETTTAADGSAETEESYDGQLVSDYSMELSYAKNFSVDYYKGGYKLITISDGRKFLTIPEGMSIPAAMEEGTVPVQMPLKNVLISSTPTMSLLNAIDVLDRVTMTTTDVDSWYIDNVVTALGGGAMTYIGDYKAPDYELITAGAPALSVFSTMLSSVPEVEEKLIELGVPILLDQATYEEHPLARVEWMKLYGALFDREEAAKTAFDEQVQYVTGVSSAESTGKTVSMFYITSKGLLYARQGGDYMAKMLELAGGEYVFADVNPQETGTNQMDFETFYATAKDADYIIYIWSLGGRPETLADFMEKNELFSEFKAVKDGNVWCTTPDYFQISNTLGYMIKDMNSMLTLTDSGTDRLTYLFKLK